jgi:hypothetical protein
MRLRSDSRGDDGRCSTGLGRGERHAERGEHTAALDPGSERDAVDP